MPPLAGSASGTLLPEIPPAERAGSEPAVASRAALAGLSLAMLMPSLATSVANTALPALGQAFAASFQATQWIVLIYLLAITTLIVAAGRLGDLIGRRRWLLVGIALFTASSLLCALTPTLWLLIAMRAVQGMGAAIMMALAMALVADAVPKERIGSAMGLLGTMSAIGTTLGPSLGGMLIAWVGWPAIFLVNVPLGGLAFALIYRSVPASSPSVGPSRAGFDGQGMAVLFVGLASYAIAMTIGGGQFGWRNIALLVTALLAGACFVLVERRAAFPLVQLQLVRDPVLSGGLATSALVSAVMMATLVVGPFYLSNALLLGPAKVGLLLSAGPLVAAITGAPAGRLVDRYGTARVGFAGLVAMVIGSCVLGFIPEAGGVAGYVTSIMLLAAGYALFQAANNSSVMAGAHARQRGVVSGMLNLSRNLGLITGASSMGAVFALGAAATDVSIASPDAIAAGMRTTFAVASGLILVALAIALRCASGRSYVAA